MSTQKFQVFVSSTFEDLKVERDSVVRAILEMGHIPVGMEMFSAADDEQWKIISRHIDQSDYYVVIVAHRYGSTTPDGQSYTQKEYEYAIERGVPVLGFLIDPGCEWPVDRVDKEREPLERLDRFKGLVKQKPVNFWTSAEGEFPGADSFDATAIFKNFRDAVMIATHARQGRSRVPRDFGGIVELVNPQWAVTEDGVECLEHRYAIQSFRFGEMNWRSHIREKTWVDSDMFDDALEVAEFLFGPDGRLHA